LPDWSASIAHEPVLSSVTAVPDTEQMSGVLEVKLTGRPEDAVAATVKDPIPSDLAGIALNVIVWLPCVTVKVSITGAAAA
jgi:hypothetical protein